MFLFLFLFPILEVVLTIGLFRQFGFADVFFAWALFTILGVGLLRTTGVRLSVSVAQSMRSGKSPGQAALEAALVGLAGILFVVPGFASDAIALVICVPFLRRLAARRLISKVRFAGSVGSPSSTGQVIDVEAVEVSSPSIKPPTDSTNLTKT